MDGMGHIDGRRGAGYGWGIMRLGVETNVRMKGVGLEIVVLYPLSTINLSKYQLQTRL